MSRGAPLDEGDPSTRKHALFNALGPDAKGEIEVHELVSRLLQAGLRRDDPRLHEVLRNIDRSGTRRLGLEPFSALIGPCQLLIERALAGRLVIPDFPTFTQELEAIYEATREIDEGEPASYIPQLSRVDPNQFAVSTCTIDGQMFSVGDCDAEFSVQSCGKPINYCLALEQHGVEGVHRYIGREPSGRGFNDMTLDPEGKPYNPMINSGAIMACSLIQQGRELADRFQYVLEAYRELSGGRRVGFSNSVYLSERRTADRNFAIGYLMREHKSFPPRTPLIETIEFYLQCCAIEASADTMAIIAATLANAGVCPTNGQRIFKTETVQNCLSLMSSCGMYDFSGEFAFTVGLPAKSGVAGAIIGVVPNVMGFCTWSPRLDSQGNSVRGIEFCKRLVDTYNFHAFDTLTGMSSKRDPRHARSQGFSDQVGQLTWAVSYGDLRGVRQLIARGVDPARGNFDQRTPLHIAASEGHRDIVDYLLSLGVDPCPVDRFGNTPLDDARRGGHAQVVETLSQLTPVRH